MKHHSIFMIFKTLALLLAMQSCAVFYCLESDDNIVYSKITNEYIQIFDTVYSGKIKIAYIADSSYYQTLSLLKNPASHELSDDTFNEIYQKYKSFSKGKLLIKPNVKIDSKDIVMIKRMIKVDFSQQVYIDEFTRANKYLLGVFSFSKIAYSSSKQFALVYRGISLGISGSRGDMFILRKLHNNWEIIFQQPLWVA